MKFLQGHFRNMWGLSAKQIRLLLRDNDNFHKVLASKSACRLSHPSSLVLPKTLIFNIDSDGGRGGEIGHWVSLLMTKHGEALFFDSMGRQLHDVNIIKYLLPHYKYIFFNSTKIQHNSSIKCGLFCIAFTKIVRTKSDYKKFIKLFSKTNLRKNDCIVESLISK